MPLYWLQLPNIFLHKMNLHDYSISHSRTSDSQRHAGYENNDDVVKIQNQDKGTYFERVIRSSFYTTLLCCPTKR